MTTEERLSDGDPPYDPKKHAAGLRMQAQNWLLLTNIYRGTRPDLAEQYERIAAFDLQRAQALESLVPVDPPESF